jgi:hypothetical protein
MHWIWSSFAEHFSPGPFHPSWPLTGLHDLCNLGQLILQSAIGVLVLVLCFVERKDFSVQIVSKLGSSFSLVPFVIVVVWTVIFFQIQGYLISHLLHQSFLRYWSKHYSFLTQASCTMLAMVASLPIAQLLFFHILLIKKVSSDTFC